MCFMRVSLNSPKKSVTFLFFIIQPEKIVSCYFSKDLETVCSNDDAKYVV